MSKSFKIRVTVYMLTSAGALECDQVESKSHKLKLADEMFHDYTETDSPGYVLIGSTIPMPNRLVSKLKIIKAMNGVASIDIRVS
jgi:hypothetical protein